MRKWNERLWLLTPAEYEQLPDGVRVQCIDGTEAVKGTDYIDQDTRAGCIAYGFTQELIQEQNLDQDFTFWMLRS